MVEGFIDNCYSRNYAHYTDRIMSIRQAKIRGEVIVAKPVLMLALIDGVDSGVFLNNSFALIEWLEERYQSLIRHYTLSSQFDKPTEINNPFWHLSTDGFWHLQLKTKGEMRTTPSKAWLKENVNYACFDEDLWVLLQSAEWRARLRDFIVEHKLMEGR